MCSRKTRTFERQVAERLQLSKRDARAKRRSIDKTIRHANRKRKGHG